MVAWQQKVKVFEYKMFVDASVFEVHHHCHHSLATFAGWTSQYDFLSDYGFRFSRKHTRWCAPTARAEIATTPRKIRGRKWQRYQWNISQIPNRKDFLLIIRWNVYCCLKTYIPYSTAVYYFYCSRLKMFHVYMDYMVYNNNKKFVLISEGAT